MKQYRIDELRTDDHQKLKTYLDERFGSSQMEGVYWVPLEEEMLDEVQSAHVQCRPFCFAVVLEPAFISFEFLIRTRNRIRCDCIHYASIEQREHIVRFADSIFEKLMILA